MNAVLDRFLPPYDHRVIHSVRLAAPPQQVRAAMFAVTPAELTLPGH
ncbi:MULTISPECIES: hypothetical protein [Streptomyces]|nr:hypothetical protein [Streptomyces sp. NEAU-HV9]